MAIGWPKRSRAARADRADRAGQAAKEAAKGAARGGPDRPNNRLEPNGSKLEFVSGKISNCIREI